MTAPRLDLYALIHKALRAYMTHTLLRVGRLDPTDAQEVAEVGDEVRVLLDFCASHVQHENEIVHVAMEARAPGCTGPIVAEHRLHEQAIDSLRALNAELARDPQAATRLYHALAVFVAENLEHMAEEETSHNAVLWAHFDDHELLEIQHRIHQRIDAWQMQLAMRWMLPHLNPAERAAVLGGVRQSAPADAFAGLLDMVRPLLPQRDWRKLSVALAL
jgi:uncharacterized protein YyaL (SSP411 family)